MSKSFKLRLSALQVALLKLLLNAQGPVSLDAIQKAVYLNAGRLRARNSAQSLAGIIRYTSSNKCERLDCRIERRTPLGRERKAVYELKGNVELLNKALEWNINGRRLA